MYEQMYFETFVYQAREMSNQENRMMNDLSIPINLTKFPRPLAYEIFARNSFDIWRLSLSFVCYFFAGLRA